MFRSTTYLAYSFHSRWLVAVVAFAVLTANATSARAAITWDGEANTNWWFDPTNWSFNGNANTSLPPADPVSSGDLQINIGTGAWDVTGEGVVYDPANDPFFAAASNVAFPTGSPLVTTAGFEGRDYGPQTLYRFYVSRNTANANLITVKSGDMVIESTTIIGRSGSTAEAQNVGRMNQLGGSVRLPLTALDIGQKEASGWGNGIYDYRGGILEVSEVGGSGIRLSAGGSAGAGGTGRFIVHNPTTPGRVRAFDFVVAANGGPNGVDDPALNPDGINTGVGIVEFHFENGGTRPIQVSRNLSINNGQDSDLFGLRSSRLDLVLNAAPAVDGGGVPGNLGLFDVNFGDVFGGTIQGTGDLDGDTVFNNDRVFSSANGSAAYREGDTVSAMFGGSTYNWTISYTGNIAWTDPATSSVSAITGAGSGVDVVLIGHSSVLAPAEDADFDGDNDVDGNDFLIWQRGLGVGTSSTGDANGDGTVNGADLTIWRNQFGGAPIAAAAGAVPEPSALALAGLGLVALAARRRQRGG
jgi:hypothetical protein